MKKLIVLLLCLLLVGCAPKVTISEENYQTITYGEIEEKINNDESFVFYLGQKGCSDCDEYLKILSKYFASHSENKIYYLDYHDNFVPSKPFEGKQTELSDIVYDLLGKDYFDMFGWEKGDLFTPTTFKVKQGEYAKVAVGQLTESNLDDFFDFSSNNISVTSISFEEVQDNLENMKDSLFYLRQDNCPACEAFERDLIIHSRLDNEVKIAKLDYKDIKDNSDAIKALKGYVFMATQDPTYLESLYTPTVFKIRNGTLKVFVGGINDTELNEILG